MFKVNARYGQRWPIQYSICTWNHSKGLKKKAYIKNVIQKIPTSDSGINQTLDLLKWGMFSTVQKVLGKSLTQTSVHANKTTTLSQSRATHGFLTGETDYQLPFKLEEYGQHTL